MVNRKTATSSTETILNHQINESADLAERLVKAYLESVEKLEVEKSIDPYDKTKDLLYGSTRVEVKLQTVFENFENYDGRKYAALTVPVATDNHLYRNQLSKCVNVDRLIFVTRPSFGRQYVGLYEAPPPGSRLFSLSINKKDRRVVAAFKLSSMKVLDLITDPDTMKLFER